jgi:hypothetical protein
MTAPPGDTLTAGYDAFPGSSNGKTAVFGAENGGSIPPPGTMSGLQATSILASSVWAL